MDRPSLGVVILMLIALVGGVHWYQTNHQRQAEMTAYSEAEHEQIVRQNAAAAKGRQTIHLYTATWCGYCKHLKADLDNSGVPYVDHDVENTAEGREFAQSAGFGGVPVTVIGSASFEGYDAEGLSQFFGDAGYKVLGLD